ncbi:MAG: class I SAM-dependent methyltransferase [Planctomycetes bacterium]|nr:class I SAM-dependent methyltransferase [Planctomycetota bacterium]
MRKLFPKQIWRRLRKEALELERERRAKEDSSLPRTPLEQKHIASLETLLDRRELLRRLPRESVGCELGVDRGVFTEMILELAAPRKLHLVDTWGDERFHEGLMHDIQAKFKAQLDGGQLEINRGLSLDVLKTFPDSYFDWVYIDTDHRYPTTRDELSLSESKVKPGGLICGHDYTLGNWIDGKRYGVAEAVREFCVKRNWKIVYLTIEDHGFQSFALERI